MTPSIRGNSQVAPKKVKMGARLRKAQFGLYLTQSPWLQMRARAQKER